MTDYKQLCAELLDWTRLLIEIPDPPVTRCADDLTDLLARTRAALAKPEPVGPTDEELLQEWNLVPGARVYEEDAVDFARAVLARWGNNTSRSI